MTNLFRLTMTSRDPASDGRGLAVQHSATALGVTTIEGVRVADLYFLRGDLDTSTAHRLAQVLLHDPVTQTYDLTPNSDAGQAGPPENGVHWVEVALHPGVTDSVAETVWQAARLLGIDDLEQVATAQRYAFAGHVDLLDLERVAGGLLANATIQTFVIDRAITPPFVGGQADDTVEQIELRAASTDELLAISRARRLALDLAEMQAIQAYFQTQNRDPSDVELEMLAQTWSEHCVHKTFKARIDYTAPGLTAPLMIDGLLKTTIRAATETLAKPWVVSAFIDNAGIVRFDERFDLAFKVETHNHPSALEPFGGANTGVGGVMRDILGVSARPIANTDVLCFGPPDLPWAQLPAGVLHPQRVAAGVVHGIEDYGNKMGVPTVNGAILFDPAYTANPLVYCGCLGILPRGAHRSLHEARPGDLVVVIGGRTGRDGLRGATFSSMEMTHETGQVAGAAVQIGHPIHEKQVLEVLLAARDEGIYSAVTDCGAGGLSSAVGEMAAELGADVELSDVPLKYGGLRPWEIWLSEAQERMVLAVPAANWSRLQALCALHQVEATALGRFTGDGQLTVRFRGTPVASLDTHFLHDGIPRRHLTAVWTPPVMNEPALAEPSGDELAHWLLRLLAQPNVASKEAVVRRYDHEVQGGTLVKPFTGAQADGPGDAAVLLPLDTLLDASTRPIDIEALPAVAVGAGINPTIGQLDPYAMAWAAVDEALRNVVAAGADPDQVAILDNFCWGNPNLPDRLGSLVRCALGCYDAALAYGTPFVSGKDSLNNEYLGADGRKHAIPGTLLISALGIVPAARHAMTMDLKAAGNLLVLLGTTADEMGGSLYYALHGALGTRPPQPPANPLGRLRALHALIRAGLVQACHDCSEGGLAVAAAEMAMAGRLGLDLDIDRMPVVEETVTLRPSTRLFAESLGRFLLEVRPADLPAVEAALAGQAACAVVGRVEATPRLRVRAGEHALYDLGLADLLAAWKQDDTR